ncbi:winged helix-turn-helix domain-containing protein [Dactylosporangium cerinum]|uniref:Winged helix-turn-helix domain-containing protein n=1 Tax=Dactylosporangium cerinum TaxID=1434730 RepID=A0ABV9W916_9ACTN
MPERTAFDTIDTAMVVNSETTSETTTAGTPPLDDKSQRIVLALAELGPQSAGNLATHLGIAYPTVTPKLRKLNAAGVAESAKADNRQTVWKLTGDGQALAVVLAAQANAADAEPAGAAATSTSAVTPPPADLERHAGQEVGQHTRTELAAGAAVTDAPDMPTQDADPDGGERSDPDDSATIALDADGTEHEHDLTSTADDVLGTADELTAADPQPATADGPDALAVGDTETATNPGTSNNNTVTSVGGTGGEAATASSDSPRPARRAAGDLDRSILRILQAHPERVYKVGQLCKLINNAEEGTGLPKASGGAVVLAAQRLVARSQAVLAVEKPTSFQLLADPANPASPAAAATVAEPTSVTAST